MCSIIGDEVLNYRVRNGTGCTHLSMDTSKYLFFRTVPGGKFLPGRIERSNISIVRVGKEFYENKPIDLLVLVS